ncbi:helix-turn-helix transcriptional regulator [uncultured Ruminococcus sp.]|uniref:helix-turn-helix domain-containing protein n=1 Tax=uncultured Ruminococcus sp. TaxID=165186 RepID=UPI00260A2529|nr:helix-turn-helix transcriptional regulator [uncultured Ruminococcus sp.]
MNYRRVRDLREDADMTQKQAAEKLFLHLTQYRRYECGESEIPLHIAINIAKLYNVSLDYIAGLSDDKKGLTRSTLTDTETTLINSFRQLDQTKRGRVLERVDVLLNGDKQDRS